MNDICMNPLFFSRDRVSLEPLAISFTGATKRLDGFLTEYLLNLLIYVMRKLTL